MWWLILVINLIGSTKKEDHPWVGKPFPSQPRHKALLEDRALLFCPAHLPLACECIYASSPLLALLLLPPLMPGFLGFLLWTDNYWTSRYPPGINTGWDCWSHPQRPRSYWVLSLSSIQITTVYSTQHTYQCNKTLSGLERWLRS